MLRTTCVATQLNAGHAENALPQRATATVNCRIMPGEDPEDVQATLVRVLADPGIAVAPVKPAQSSDASELSPRVVGVVERLARERWGVPVIPVMEVGATDGLHVRNAGVPTFGVSALFDPPDENRAHGRDERVAVESFYGAVEFWDAMIKALAAAP
jgi:acetylornithine deacetylase/succinyl-diaminopimelate desuccinylase-like protein